MLPSRFLVYAWLQFNCTLGEPGVRCAGGGSVTLPQQEDVQPETIAFVMRLWGMAQERGAGSYLQEKKSSVVVKKLGI